jgi:Protein of unknwon function (DUF3310)
MAGDPTYARHIAAGGMTTIDVPMFATNTPRAGESAEQTAARTAPRDAVVLPNHYARFKIEPVAFICENKLDFFQGNVVKYVCRHDAKNGIEDLKKAKRYIEMYIKYLQDDPDWWKQPKADGA